MNGEEESRPDTPLRIACVGEAMIELSGLGTPDARVALATAGDTYNTAVYLARALPVANASVAYVSALGDDPFSDRILDDMVAEGIDTRAVPRLPDRLPGLYAIELDPGGERRFHYWRDASAARHMFDPGGVPWETLAAFDVIYLSGITLAILPPEARERLCALCHEMRASGRHVIFDSNYRPRLWRDVDTTRDAMRRMWAAVTIGLPSCDDEVALWGDSGPAAILDRLSQLGVPEIALKRGASGPLLHHADLPSRREGSYPPATTIVDTTAAGDSFNAGYIAARLFGADMTAAAEAGHALATRVIGHRGAILPRD
jgi:2-dehydro-3-deoxygluconokinase